ncbi:acetolactate synthase-1/2/3 large subunit [Herbaspirillum rubrisubalbicans]|uniref:acetolactate synthase large subunit n=1 Tax=Herbaspirillum rubrisubalbicans TaxID=80842 RepID=UPI00209DD7B1|nr:acetolactate synthase large subunit [Herbaspirillum rubrisubalbicans]MCP1574460.1 acetolactate synthase-1/2/3 large subunit [Herbaspirillum rubrisubalbicans]
MTRYTGAHALWAGLQAQGVDTCFANPGTTELDLVRGLESFPKLRCVVALQENVCTGAADGYGRMLGRPASTLLHLGPGFANGIANLHNARRARTPIVNIIGDHTSWHLPYDAPLSSDIESLARPVSGWVHRISGSADIAPAAAESVRQSLAAGGQGSTLIFPADFQFEEMAVVEASATAHQHAAELSDDYQPEQALARLKGAQRVVVLLGGGGEDSGLGARAQRAVARIAAHLGCSVYAETFPARAERGQGLPSFDRLPYFPEPARKVLDDADLVVLVGALPPITYFGYVGHPSALVAPERLLTISLPGHPAAERVEQLADALQAPAYVTPQHELPAQPEGELTPQKIAAVLARELPERAIVSVEGGTCGYPFYAVSDAARPHTVLTNTGGAIGQGLPVALGAAVACPDRTVVGLLSDGSTQYTIQTLWSLAHEQAKVVVLIAANHQYAILRNELRRDGATLGERAAQMTSLEHPRIDWVGLAHSYGVPASRAENAQQLQQQLQAALAGDGPALIEMAL